jgi:hypothetical protein
MGTLKRQGPDGIWRPSLPTGVKKQWLRNPKSRLAGENPAPCALTHLRSLSKPDKIKTSTTVPFPQPFWSLATWLALVRDAIPGQRLFLEM